MVDFISTDIHKPDSKLFDRFDEIKRKIIKITSEDKFNEITCNNMVKVVNNEDI